MFLTKNKCTPVWWGVIGIVVLSATLFLQAVLQTNIDTPIRGDSRDYLAYAFNLKTHGIYSRSWNEAEQHLPHPDALRAPGYPWLLSFFVDKSSKTFAITNLLLLQAMLGVVTVLLYLLLYCRFMSVGWALAAGLITSISPHLINASVYVLSESVFTFLLAAHLLVLERAIRLKQIRWALLAGILLAISLLVRPTTQYLALVYLMVVIARFRFVACQHWKILASLIIPVILVTAAWATRNVIETGRMSDPTLTANFLQHGMYINMMYEGHPETYGYPYRFDPMNSEMAGKTGKILEEIGDRLWKEPARYSAWFLIGKPMQFFSWNLTESIGNAFIFAPIYSPYFDQGLFKVTHALAKALHPFMMFFGVMGAFLAVLKTNKSLAATLMGVVMLYFLALHMIGAPFPRYSIPIRPISYGLALFSLQAITHWIQSRLKRRTVARMFAD